MTKVTPTQIIVQGDTARIVIHHRLHGECVIEFDTADVPRVAPYHWNVVRHDRTLYARTWRYGRNEFMHRILLDFPDEMIDHRDLNGLNNRRANLREATHQLNAVNVRRLRTNTSGFRGVSWSKVRCKWIAQIEVNSRSKNLGGFETAEEAARAYDAAAVVAFGGFATLNFPDELEAA